MDQRMLKKMIEQAQKQQKVMQVKIAEFDSSSFSETYGANHVQIDLKGNFEIQKIIINQSLLMDKEMLEEILAEAWNSTIKKIQSQREELENSLMPQQKM